MERQDEAISSLQGKIDRLTWLLVTTLAAAVVNLLYVALDRH
jgi:hypothetical protein